MGWPEVISQILTVLITGAVGVLSARYGAKSALDVAEKNNRGALERVQYERTRQKREEIIEVLYAELRELEQVFWGIAVAAEGLTQERTLEILRDNERAFQSKLFEVRRYHDSRAIWLDSRSSQAIDRLLNQYREITQPLNVAFYRFSSDSEGKPNVSANENPEIAAARAKIWRWRREEYPQLDETIRTSLQQSLNAAPARTDK